MILRNAELTPYLDIRFHFLSKNSVFLKTKFSHNFSHFGNLHKVFFWLTMLDSNAANYTLILAVASSSCTMITMFTFSALNLM